MVSHKICAINKIFAHSFISPFPISEPIRHTCTLNISHTEQNRTEHCPQYNTWLAVTGGVVLQDTFYNFQDQHGVGKVRGWTVDERMGPRESSTRSILKLCPHTLVSAVNSTSHPFTQPSPHIQHYYVTSHHWLHVRTCRPRTYFICIPISIPPFSFFF